MTDRVLDRGGNGGDAALVKLVMDVRAASADGRLVPLAQVWDGTPGELERQLREPPRHPDPAAAGHDPGFACSGLAPGDRGPEGQVRDGLAPDDDPNAQEEGGGAADDVRFLTRGEATYLYSTRYMTPGFAAVAARAADRDLPRAIAETVRENSATYPRPTPPDVFLAAPFCLTADALAAALGELARDPCYADIRTCQASDGSPFLYSTESLSGDHARSLAEWLAVGRYENP